MKKLIYGVSFLALIGLVMVGCEKEEKSNTSFNHNQEMHQGTKLKFDNNKSTPGYVYFTSNNAEFDNKINYLNTELNFESNFYSDSINNVDSVLQFTFADERVLNALEISNNNYVMFLEGSDYYFRIELGSTSSGTNYEVFDQEENNIAAFIGLNELNDEGGIFVSNGTDRSGDLLIQCVQDHFNDICGDNFWTATACALGCAGCPECCLAAAGIFAVDCAVQIYSS